MARTFNKDLKLNHSKQKLAAKKEESSMEQEITDKAEKVKGEQKQKAMLVLARILTASFFVFAIYFVFKPITEFLLMCEYYIRLYILNYFFK